MKGRLVLTAVGLVLLGVASTQAWAKAVTITYWEPWAGTYRDINKKVIDAFNKEYAGRIEVNMVVVPSAQEKVLTAIAGGVAPDLFKVDRFEVGSYAAKNVVMPLDEYIKRDGIKPESFFGAPWSENVYGGKVYGLPWNTDARGMWYNRTLFKDIGLDPNAPPRTWEDTTAIARKFDMVDNGKFQRVGFLPSNGNWYFLGWLWAAGGEMTTPDGKKATWDSAAGLKAANFISDAILKYGGPVAASRLPLDGTTGKVAMWMEGSFWIGYLKENKSALKKYEFDVAPPPRPAGLEKDPVTWAGGFSLAIPRGAKHPKEAWEFIKYYCTNRDAQVLLGSSSGQIPGIKEAAYDERFLSAYPTLRTFVDLLPKARFRTVLPCGTQLWALYNDQLMDMLVNARKGPSEALTTTAKLGQSVLNLAWSRVRK